VSDRCGGAAVGTADRPQTWGRWGLAGLAAVGAVLALRAWGRPGDAGDTTCLLRQAAHVGCATCGMTRALVALARGDWSRSFACHPFGLLLAAQLAAGWLLWGVRLARGGPRLPAGWAPRLAVANGGMLLALWLARLGTGTLPL